MEFSTRSAQKQPRLLCIYMRVLVHALAGQLQRTTAPRFLRWNSTESGPASATTCILSMLPDLPIIYEDAHIIVVNKPYNMLSVPGKAEIPKLSTRVQDWQCALVAAPATVRGLPSEACAEVLETIAANPENVPRKEKKFLAFLQRSFRVKDDEIAKEAWNYVCIVDEQLNSVPLDPEKSNISATEVVRASHKKVWNVHRLDCETSGVLVMAFTEDATAHLSAQFRNGLTEKRYVAVVSGHVDPSLDRVMAPIRADFENKPLQVIDLEKGKESETLVRLLRYSTDDKGFRSSVVELTPITGRTHQLRLHMRHCGHTILGDSMYAQGTDLERSSRLLLHARSLRFEHPVTGEKMHFTAECPFVSIDEVTAGDIYRVSLQPGCKLVVMR